MFIVQCLNLDVVEDKLCGGFVLWYTRLDHNVGQRNLACNTFVHDSNDCNVFHLFVFDYKVFELCGGDLISLELDQIFGAVRDEHVPMFIFVSNVT